MLIQQRLQHRPDIIDDARLGLGAGMYAISLHQCGVIRHSGQQKRHQGQVIASSQFAEQGLKLFGVLGAIIRRDAHLDQDHPGAGLPGQLDHGGQVGLYLLQGQCAQTVVAAQFEDDDGGIMTLQSPGQTGQTAAGGIAADAGVYYPMRKACFLQPVL